MVPKTCRKKEDQFLQGWQGEEGGSQTTCFGLNIFVLQTWSCWIPFPTHTSQWDTVFIFVFWRCNSLSIFHICKACTHGRIYRGTRVVPGPSKVWEKHVWRFFFDPPTVWAERIVLFLGLYVLGRTVLFLELYVLQSKQFIWTFYIETSRP